MTTEHQPAPDPSRTEKPHWLTLDQQLAPTTAANRLGEEFKGFYGPGTIGWSGGSEPGVEVNPSAVEAMAERGIDITPAETGGPA